jgi:hypothetical protein
MKYIVEQKELENMMNYLAPVFAPAQIDLLVQSINKILQKVDEEKIPLSEGDE